MVGALLWLSLTAGRLGHYTAAAYGNHTHDSLLLALFRNGLLLTVPLSFMGRFCNSFKYFDRCS